MDSSIVIRTFLRLRVNEQCLPDREVGEELQGRLFKVDSAKESAAWNFWWSDRVQSHPRDVLANIVCEIAVIGFPLNHLFVLELIGGVAEQIVDSRSQQPCSGPFDLF